MTFQNLVIELWEHKSNPLWFLEGCLVFYLFLLRGVKYNVHKNKNMHFRRWQWIKKNIKTKNGTGTGAKCKNYTKKKFVQVDNQY